jgi:SagB-type dehydrogenase family enzyme
MPKVIKLPAPVHDGNISVEKALSERRSVRKFQDVPLDIAEVSQLLRAAQGITDSKGFRTTPSAGALYPLEVYVAAGSVKGLSPGVYKYKPAGHELILVKEGDARASLKDAALGQSVVKDGAIVIIIAGVYERTTAKYPGGEKYVHMEAGHSAQNVYLQAHTLGLGTVAVGAFNDNAVERAAMMSENERPLYLMPVGRPA